MNVGNRGGVAYEAATAIHNGTISGNSVNVNLGFGAGGIESNVSALSINEITVSGNRGGAGNGVGITSTSLIKVQNGIVANHAGGNCSGTIT